MPTCSSSTLPAGQTLELNGGGASDIFRITPSRGNAKEILGQVIVDAGLEGGSLDVTDTSNTAGAVVHIEPGTESTLGSSPGDTLFSQGGSLQYRNLMDGEGLFGYGLLLNLGSGPDAIYAKPQAAASIEVIGNDPTIAPGDRLFLSLANALNPQVIPTQDGWQGQVTSSNFAPVRWLGIEQVSTDYVAPNGFLIVNTLDSGPGSLRQALLDANSTANVGGPDVIRFSIPGVGAHTIRPSTPLPGITDPVVLDATTQPGYAGKPIIELDGSLAASSDGLTFYASGNNVRGLVINRFVGSPNGGIHLYRSSNNIIQGNYIGTNLAGDAVFPLSRQMNYGVIIFGGDNNVIGTDSDGVNDAAEGNVISGQNTAGILLEVGQPGELPDNNAIAGNRIGTNAGGNAALGNGRMGIFFIHGGTGNRIGTRIDGIFKAAERNLISGNTEAGIFLDSDGNSIAGNYIGTDMTGKAPLGNGDGIRIDGANKNQIGGADGIGSGVANVIAFNTYSGVLITRGGSGNAILGNSIFANGRIGINLSVVGELANGVSLNDATDADSGVNNLQNFPQITAALASSTETLVGGTLKSTANTPFRIEFFASPTADSSGYGEGKAYVGFTTASTDGAGSASFVTNLSITVPAGQFLSATATDDLGNTSEFSASVQVVPDGSLPNVTRLPIPRSDSYFLVSSPPGTRISATLARTAGVSPPSGLEFPFGFLSFTVSGLTRTGTDVTISGLDTNQIVHYYKYGATPARRSDHWYDFLYGQKTDQDSAADTGMELIGGSIVLHLIDGKRGDDDLNVNGVIVDIGGPVANRLPAAVPDAVTVNEDTILSVNASVLKKNDTDADGDTLTVTAVGGATNGTVVLNNNGKITFVPSSNFYGTAGFDYTLSDGNATAIGRVTVTVKEVNDRPTAFPDLVTVTEDSEVNIDVRSNDSRGPANESGQTLSVKSVSAQRGKVTINSDGTLRYRPPTDYSGSDMISYTIVDNGKTNGAADPLSASSKVAVTITAVNDPPVAKDLTVAVTEDGTIELKLSATDIETSDSALLFNVTSLPTRGQLSTEKGGAVRVGEQFKALPPLIYKPGATSEGIGTDSFKYTVTDTNGLAGALSDEGIVTLNITKAVADGMVTLDSQGIVRIGGSMRDDDIVVSTSGSRLQVNFNGKPVKTEIGLSKVREIRVWGRAGNDKISVLLLDVPTMLHGGADNDQIIGALGSNLIFGGAGKDSLWGGPRNDLLVGESGSDSIIDASGDDVLIGGTVSDQLTDDFMRQVLQQWGTAKSQDSRFKLGLANDNAVDSLFDSLGDDWYIIGAGDSNDDRYPSDHDAVTTV